MQPFTLGYVDQRSGTRQARHSGRRMPMSPQARERSLDELAKGLASGNLSRRKALKLVGATLVGGALASIPGIASAKPNKPEGAKCNHNHQCASEQCVEGRCGSVGPICDPPCPEGEECTEGRPPFPPFCRPIPPTCTPSCPENCGCFVTADGTTRCISCPLGICALNGVTSCEDCDPVAEVCIPGPGGDFPFSCAPLCPA